MKRLTAWAVTVVVIAVMAVFFEDSVAERVERVLDAMHYGGLALITHWWFNLMGVRK